MSNFISASSLNRCGYARVLKKGKKPSANSEKAMAKGNVFHKAIEEYIPSRIAARLDDEEVIGWLDRLLAQWTPPENVEVELPLGLGLQGQYVAVSEVAPHVYLPLEMCVTSAIWEVADQAARDFWIAESHKIILTGGRADLVYTEGDIVCVDDWKTGKYMPEDPNTNLQLWSLGLAASELYQLPKVRVGLYMAQQGRFYRSDVIERRSRAWLDRFADIEQSKDACLAERPVPTPEACRSCWERKACAHDCTREAA